MRIQIEYMKPLGWRDIFQNLCDLMGLRDWLKDCWYFWVDEQVGIFLSLVSHNNSNRYLCERFQCSEEKLASILIYF